MTTQTDEIIEDLAEGIAWLDSDSMWELCKHLNKKYPLAANLLKADLVHSELDSNIVE
jgi:hypothetical protein